MYTYINSELGMKLVNLVESFNMSQLIDGVTRGNHLLDLLITDAPAYFTDVDILPPFDDLDHSTICGSFLVTRPKPTSVHRKIWQYHLGNFLRLNNLLLSTDWTIFFSETDDIDILAERFTKTLLNLAETCIPTKTILIRSPRCMEMEACRSFLEPSKAVTKP